MKKIYLMLLVLPFFFSCDEEDTTSNNQEKNDCILYEPTEASNVIQGSWSEPNEKDQYINEIAIPDDVGGGYVKVLLSQGNQDLRPLLIVNANLNQGAAIISGSSAQTDNELNRLAYFSVHPGEKYTIDVQPFFNANTEDYPVDYTLEWEFFSKVDCFEPNDSQAEAKKILLGEIIEAYAIAGYINDSVGAGDPNTYDWYKVELDEAAVLQARLADMPKDMRITLRFFNEDGSTLGIDTEYSDPDLPGVRGKLPTITSTRELDAGTYYIELHSDFVEARKANNDLQPIPEHFNKAYKLITSKL